MKAVGFPAVDVQLHSAVWRVAIWTYGRFSNPRSGETVSEQTVLFDDLTR